MTNSFDKATYRQRLTHFTETLNFMSEERQGLGDGPRDPRTAQMGLNARIPAAPKKRLTSLHTAAFACYRIGGQGAIPPTGAGMADDVRTRRARNFGNCSRPRTARRPCSTTRPKRPPCALRTEKLRAQRLAREAAAPPAPAKKAPAKKKAAKAAKAKPRPLSDWLSDQKKDGRRLRRRAPAALTGALRPMMRTR